jgi:nitroreductase
MDIWEAIKKRRSVRAFKGPVPETTLRRIILAGSKAPSAGNSQPWEFIHVHDNKIIDQIAEQKYQMNSRFAGEEAGRLQRNTYQNSSVVAVCYKSGGLSNIAAWLATLNMELAATAEGYAGVTSTLVGDYKAAVEKILGLPEGYELATVMVLGVPAVMPKQRQGGVERPDYSWLHVDRFGSAK